MDGMIILIDYKLKNDKTLKKLIFTFFWSHYAGL